MKNLKTMLMGTIKVMTVGLFIFGCQGIFAWKPTKEEFLKEEFLNALKNGDFTKVKNLINYDKTLVNTQNRQYVKGRTALHVATRDGYLDRVKFLIENGANVNATDVDGYTPLHYASLFGEFKIANLLIANGAK